MFWHLELCREEFHQHCPGLTNTTCMQHATLHQADILVDLKRPHQVARELNQCRCPMTQVATLEALVITGTGAPGLTATAHLRLAMQDDDLAGRHLPQYPADAGPVCPALEINQAGLSTHWHHEGPGNDSGGNLPGVLLRLQGLIASTACSIQSFAARPSASEGGLDATFNAWSAAPSTVAWHGSLHTRMKETLTAATPGWEASLAAHVQAGTLPAASLAQGMNDCPW